MTHPVFQPPNPNYKRVRDHGSQCERTVWVGPGPDPRPSTQTTPVPSESEA